MTALIVLAAFDDDGEGNLVPAFQPRQVDTAERAVREARMMADQHTSVVAWSRTADLANGDYGEPVVLFQRGPLPEME